MFTAMFASVFSTCYLCLNETETVQKVEHSHPLNHLLGRVKRIS